MGKESRHRDWTSAGKTPIPLPLFPAVFLFPACLPLPPSSPSALNLPLHSFPPALTCSPLAPPVSLPPPSLSNASQGQLLGWRPPGQAARARCLLGCRSCLHPCGIREDVLHGCGEGEGGEVVVEMDEVGRSPAARLRPPEGSQHALTGSAWSRLSRWRRKEGDSQGGAVRGGQRRRQGRRKGERKEISETRVQKWRRAY
eukprot:754841-Hanusia_phi.AAC.1